MAFSSRVFLFLIETLCQMSAAMISSSVFTSSCRQARQSHAVGNIQVRAVKTLIDGDSMSKANPKMELFRIELRNSFANSRRRNRSPNQTTFRKRNEADQKR